MTALIVDDTPEQMALLQLIADKIAKVEHIDCCDVDSAIKRLSEVDRVITDGLDFGDDLRRLVAAALNAGKEVTVVTGTNKSAIDKALGNLAQQVNFVDRENHQDIIAAFK